MTGCHFEDTRWGYTLLRFVSQDMSRSTWTDSSRPLTGTTRSRNTSLWSPVSISQFPQLSVFDLQKWSLLEIIEAYYKTRQFFAATFLCLRILRFAEPTHCRVWIKISTNPVETVSEEKNFEPFQARTLNLVLNTLKPRPPFWGSLLTSSPAILN